MKLLEAIQLSTEFLAKKQVESPRLQAELLLSAVLKIPRMQLYLSFERVLCEAELDAYRQSIRRRGQREPLQHIIGSTCFCGLDLAVNSHVLVPRPETELLAEQGWTFLNGLPATPGKERRFALDWGTGSGCIALALAAHCESAHIYGLDISAEALAVAQANAAALNLSSRITFLAGNGLEALPQELKFDLVISNPPYIPSAEIADLEPEVRDHDPRLALDGGADGLEFYRRIAADAPGRLRSGGKLMLEFGDGQAESVSALLQEQKWIVEKISADYTQRLRTLVASPR